MGAKEPRHVGRWGGEHSYWKVEAGGCRYCLRCVAQCFPLYLGSDLCTAQFRGSGGWRGAFQHGQRCWRQRATLVGFTPASLRTPSTWVPPVAVLGRTGPKARGRVWQTLCVSPPPPSGLPLPQPHLSGKGFRNQCSGSGLGGLQPDCGSRGGFWARALPACGCVLSVIDSPVSGWLFFFFPLALIFILALSLPPCAYPLTHPASRKLGSGRLALAALGIIFFLIRNGAETLKTGERE